MHEASLVQYTLRSIRRAAAQNHISKVSEILLKIGKLKAVHNDAMQHLFSIMTHDDDMFSSCRLDIITLPVVIECLDCHQISKLSENEEMLCPRCHSENFHLIGGTELLIASFQGKHELGEVRKHEPQNH